MPVANMVRGRTISSMVKHTILFAFLSVRVFACDFFPPLYKVPRSFCVHVTNEMGPVVGLKLKVYRTKWDVVQKLTEEELQSVDPKDVEEIIAESTTDSTGTAKFALDRSGAFTLEPVSPANHLDWVQLDVSDDPTPVTVELKWPSSSILRTSQLRGILTTGLMSSRSAPLKGDVLTLRSMVEYKDVASTTTDESGKFEFGDVPPGLYFIHLAPTPTKSDQHYYEGNIAVYVSSKEPRENLAISTIYSSCGLGYDLEANKEKYRPVVCFKGGEQVACDY